MSELAERYVLVLLFTRDWLKSIRHLLSHAEQLLFTPMELQLSLVVL
jgi:hypothetical protein